MDKQWLCLDNRIELFNLEEMANPIELFYLEENG